MEGSLSATTSLIARYVDSGRHVILRGVRRGVPFPGSGST